MFAGLAFSSTAAKKENRKVLIFVGFALCESKSPCLVLNFFSRKQAKVLTRF